MRLITPNLEPNRSACCKQFLLLLFMHYLFLRLITEFQRLDVYSKDLFPSVRLRWDFTFLNYVQIPWSTEVFCKWWKSFINSHCEEVARRLPPMLRDLSEEGVDSAKSVIAKVLALTDTSFPLTLPFHRSWRSGRSVSQIEVPYLSLKTLHTFKNLKILMASNTIRVRMRR